MLSFKYFYREIIYAVKAFWALFAVRFMSDLARDLRLAVDTGSVALGTREVMRSISEARAKLVVIAGRGRVDVIADISHACNIASIRTVKFTQGSMELGSVCGRPHSVNAVAIIEPGNSNILNETYA